MVLKILDLFLLALIADGIDTPYRWQRQAAVSLGASLPSIRRMGARGLVREAEPGPRGSRRFSLTRAGRTELKKFTEYLETAMAKPNLDVESVLRLVSIGYTRGKHDLVASLLNRAVLNLPSRGATGGRPSAIRLPSQLAEFYSEALTQYENEKQLAAVRTIDALLKRTKLPADGKSRVERRRQKV